MKVEVDVDRMTAVLLWCQVYGGTAEPFRMTNKLSDNSRVTCSLAR